MALRPAILLTNSVCALGIFAAGGLINCEYSNNLINQFKDMICMM
jgi:hypothetical protein